MVFNRTNALPGKENEIPLACGQCTGCRLEHSRRWAIRCMHEAKMHEHNYFLTNTYNEQNIPHHHTLNKEHLQKFWKRLRDRRPKLRYYACGEYGELTERPHYHAIVFGLNITDKKHYCTNNGNKIYTSETIDKIWGKGYVYIGDVTFESCAYVSRYVLKKWKARSEYELKKHYERVDGDTGEVYHIIPEYVTMSQGIGADFYKKFKADMYRPGMDGTVNIRGGITCQTPSYYDNKFEKESIANFNQLENIKTKRREHHERRVEDNTPTRLKTKENIAHNRATRQLPRKNH